MLTQHAFRRGVVLLLRCERRQFGDTHDDSLSRIEEQHLEL